MVCAIARFRISSLQLGKSYRFRIDTPLLLCGIRPPVVEGVRTDEITLLQERHAALDQRFFELISRSSKSRLARASFANGHNLSAGCNSGERADKNSRWMPSGTSTSLPVCQPA